MDIEDHRQWVDRKLAALAVARGRYRAESNALQEATDRAGAILEAQNIAQHVAQLVQQQAHQQIASIVSRCLEAIFDEPYTFVIEFDRKRGRTEAALTFQRDGISVDPMTASGGGVVDVAAFALRLSCMLLSKPSVRKLLILDEPFKFVSAEYRPRLRSMIESLSKELGVQFLVVTHIEELQIGKVVHLPLSEENTS
jgi:DNA repair exonuclease SbcCD ATPase subunit